MKYIFHFCIIAVIMVLVISQNATDVLSKEDMMSTVTEIRAVVNGTVSDLATHDTDIKADIAQHDTDVKTNIATHNSNLIAHDFDVKTKLEEILAAVQNGGGGGTDTGAPVEKTGQTASFETGDDGDVQAGVAWPNPRFTDNLDGTITDNLTHIIWDKNANRFGPKEWSHAVFFCNNLADNGGDLTDGSVAGDWHLANVKEYQSLIHYGFSNPAIPDTNGTNQWVQGDPFNNVQSSDYWTSTTFAGAGLDNYAWRMGFYGFGGGGGTTTKSNAKNVWCVKRQ